LIRTLEAAPPVSYRERPPVRGVPEASRIPGEEGAVPIDLSHRTNRKLSAGEDFVDDGAEPLPDPADRYLVDPRTTVMLPGN
jgi:hypothetical protein